MAHFINPFNYYLLLSVTPTSILSPLIHLMLYVTLIFCTAHQNSLTYSNTVNPTLILFQVIMQWTHFTIRPIKTFRVILYLKLYVFILFRSATSSRLIITVLHFLTIYQPLCYHFPTWNCPITSYYI